MTAAGKKLREELAEVKARLEEAEETLRAIREGEVDALVVSGKDGDRLYSLQGAESSYRLFLEQMQEGAATLASDGVIVFANRSFAEIFGKELHDILGKPLKRLLPKKTAELVAELVKTGKEKSQSLQIKFSTKAEPYKSLRVSCSPAEEGAGDHANIVVTDVTDRESDERFRLAAHASHTMVYDLAVPSLEINALEGVGELLGYGPSEVEFSLDWWNSQIHPDDLTAWRAAFERLQVNPADHTLHYRVRHKDGRILWVEDHATPIGGEDRRPSRIVGTVMDITDRKRSEEALRDSEKRLLADLDAMTRLQKLGSLFIHEDDLEPILREIVDAAIAITQADFGNIQLCDPQTSDLQIVAQRGFSEWWIDYWNSASHGKGACGTAFEHGERTVIEDVEKSPVFMDSPALEMQLKAGVRAVQSTPLVSRTGKIVGMFSTHHKKPHLPSERELVLLDLLARQASDIIVRARSAQALRESEERFRVAQELSPDGFTILRPVRDAEGSIVDFAWVYENSAIARLNGTDPEEVVGKRLLELFPNHRGSVFFDVYKHVAETHDPRIFEAKYDGGISTPTWVRLVVVPMANDIAILAQDITERKRTGDALAEAKQEAERANQAKDQFLAVLSHELRTPLAAVLAAVQLMQRKGRLSDEARANLEMIRRNVQLEARLIDDLLDLTRIVRGKILLEKKPLDLKSVIERVVETCKPNIESRTLNFGVSLEKVPLVSADSARLQQVIWNLLNNAIKFTPDGGSVRVRCFTEGEQVVVEISDSGIGVEPEAKSRIFNAFEQGEASITRQFGGLGLGLSISKRIVELHGGNISVESPGKNQGAVFRVSLPVVWAEAEAEAEAEKLQTDAGKVSRRILLVEDHGDTARLMQALLESAGYQVKTAGGAREALSAIASDDFDLLISDLGLPDQSGLEMMQELRRRGSLLKGIALSGYGRADDVRRSREAGFSGHLTKPVDFDSLVAAVDRMLLMAA